MFMNDVAPRIGIDQPGQKIHKLHRNFGFGPLVRARAEPYRFRCAALLVE